jgi:hypothetical protein
METPTTGVVESDTVNGVKVSRLCYLENPTSRDVESANMNGVKVSRLCHFLDLQEPTTGVVESVFWNNL